jgi:hypothetical protein
MSKSLRLVALAHLLGNAVLMAVAYYWLGIGESRTSTLVWSAAVALFLVCAACWLHGSSFAYFAQPKGGIGGATRVAARRLIPLVIFAAVVFGIYLLVSVVVDLAHAGAFHTASYSTMKLKRPVKPAWTIGAVDVVFWIVRWMLLPVLLLPAAAAIATRGWSGFRHVGAMRGNRLYWLATPLLLVCAFQMPLWLFRWIPKMPSFGAELASLLLRLGIGYLLFVAAWLALMFLTSGGSPRFTQPKTAASP